MVSGAQSTPVLALFRDYWFGCLSTAPTMAPKASLDTLDLGAKSDKISCSSSRRNIRQHYVVDTKTVSTVA